MTADVHADAIVFDDLEHVDRETGQPPIYDRPIGLRLLYEDPTSGDEHYLVEYPPRLEAQRHRHSVAHTIIVLAGQLAVNGQTIGPRSYCHFPGGSVMHHAPAGETACLFVTIFHGPFDVEAVLD